jgi:endonuclease/exonuclease/phosphatase family metal-dependent hydrolase
MRIRVLTYNIHKGICFYNRQYVLSELREAIRSVDADIVFLQEVLGMHPPDKPFETELASQFEFLADEIWHHFAYGKNAVYSSGHHGNAVLSKFPIVAYDNIDISNTRLERRGLLHAVLQVGKGEHDRFHAVNLHLDLLEWGRFQQISRLVTHIRNQIPDQHALIVAGDFNDWKARLSEPLAQELNLKEAGIEHLGKHAKTFPTWMPMLPLDRVYVRGFEIRSHSVLNTEPWSRMSDHAAVTVDLEWKS